MHQVSIQTGSGVLHWFCDYFCTLKTTVYTILPCTDVHTPLMPVYLPLSTWSWVTQLSARVSLSIAPDLCISTHHSFSYSLLNAIPSSLPWTYSLSNLILSIAVQCFIHCELYSTLPNHLCLHFLSLNWLVLMPIILRALHLFLPLFQCKLSYPSDRIHFSFL